MLEPIFSELVLDNQQMMSTPANREKILFHVPPGIYFISDYYLYYSNFICLEEQNNLREKFDKDGGSSTPQSKWADLKKTIEASVCYH